MLNKEQEKKCIEAIVNAGELNLGFCKIVKKKIKGGRSKLRGSFFKRSDHYKLSVTMSQKMKDSLSTD